MIYTFCSGDNASIVKTRKPRKRKRRSEVTTNDGEPPKKVQIRQIQRQAKGQIISEGNLQKSQQNILQERNRLLKSWWAINHPAQPPFTTLFFRMSDLVSEMGEKNALVSKNKTN